jgi:hypothetical protein
MRADADFFKTPKDPYLNHLNGVGSLKNICYNHFFSGGCSNSGNLFI